MTKLPPPPHQAFHLPDQSVLSFSGGRTSGYMLHEVARAHRSQRVALPVVTFANTGLEAEETLRFVRDCAENWGVPVRWLEYRWEAGRHYFVEVDFDSASRHGEPFRLVIAARGFLPNPVMRFCTAELKIRTCNRFVRQSLGWQTYRNAIGLRADEPKRVAKLLARRTVTVEQTLFGEETHVERGASHPTGETPVVPLYDAGVTNEDVLAFWRQQPFDLALPVDERTGRTKLGNCVGCFLKSTRTLIDIFRQRDDAADWWIESETLIPSPTGSGDRFRSDRARYVELKMIADGAMKPPLFTESDHEGLACGEHPECNCTD